MSKLSIYENSWLDLVFEGRNKEYGAYQLRQQNPQTTLKALFFGTLICASLVSIPVISGLLRDAEPVADNPNNDGPIVFVDFMPEKPIIVEPKPETAKASAPEKSSAKQDVFVIPKVTDNQTAVTEMTLIDKSEKTGSTENIGDNQGAISLGNGTLHGTGKDPETVVNTAENGGAGIVDIYSLQKNPEFPGGINKFLELVGSKFRTPEDIESKQTMKVFVYFVVEKDGSLTNISVLRDPGHGLGKEAIRVLKSIKTKWSPGIQNNQPVRTAYNLPISVKIQ